MEKRVSCRICATIALWLFCASVVWASSVSSARDVNLDGGDWRMGSFAMGAGEPEGVATANFDDSGFRLVTVPGNTQLQAGFTGVGSFVESKGLIAVNEKEWWYRKSFKTGLKQPGTVSRIVFDGVDYFATVWLNGHLLGSHQGGFTSFSFDVTSLLNYGEDNVLAVRVTHPWIPPDGRALTEYIDGNFSVPNLNDGMKLAKPPYYLSVSWDALPAQGNAALPMGIWRSVHLRTSGPITISDLYAETRSIEADGSAVLHITATLDNATNQAQTRKVELVLRPSNFAGPAQSIPALALKALPGESTAEEDVRVPNAQLWWTWDTGKQNLYELDASIAPQDGMLGYQRKVRFGIRTITRGADMGYTLNGRRLFIKGAWLPIDNFYLSTPTEEDYERDLRLARDGNLNMLVNFTVIEKSEFYDLCDQLGILVVVEMPFPQPGPAQVLDQGNPRREPFLKQAHLQISEMVTALRDHPSIIEWAALAEAHSKQTGKWSVGKMTFDQEGYGTFIKQMRSIVTELAPGTIFHPSLCDLGEQHFWYAAAEGGDQGDSYEKLFDAKADFISEYGSISMSSYENLSRYLSPDEQWGTNEPNSLRLFGLPISTNAYAYWTSYANDGLYSMLYRTEHYVDGDPRSARELVTDTQLYQAFLMKYAAEAFRRKKYDPITGIRFWDFLELEPGFHFGIVDYDRVPKIAYWYMKRAQAPVAISFAFKDALASQIAGRPWSAPVWIVNDTGQNLSGTIHAELLTLQGQQVAAKDFPTHVAADGKDMAGVFSLTLPQSPGVYVLRALLRGTGENDPVTEASYIKVVPPAFPGSHRVLLIAQSRYAAPIATMLRGLGLDVDIYDQNRLSTMATDFRDGAAIHAKYDVIWLGNFEALSKALPPFAALALQNAVRLGTGFIVTGGDGSFHGGAGHAAVTEATALSSIFPVTMLETGIEDLMTGGFSMDETLPTHSSIHDIAAGSINPEQHAAAIQAEKPLQRFGLPGFNLVSARSAAHTVLTIAGHPLLVTGTYGAGKVAAFTGFTPAEDEYSTSSLDDQFIEEPANRAYFVTFAALMKEVLPGDPQLSANLLEEHEKPLFQILKELPQTQLTASKIGDCENDGERRFCRVRIANNGGYAHLVHLEVEWSADGRQPYLTEFTDNDFELLPNESREIVVEWRSKFQGEIPNGELIVDAANAGLIRLTLQNQLALLHGRFRRSARM